MKTFRRLLLCLSATLTLMGSQPERPPQPNSEAFLRGLYFDLHAAVPLGSLAADVNDQLGFGLSLGYQAKLGEQFALRASFRWTGYRVSDRNLGARMLASIFDASYEEDRLILRSYSLGGDFLAYRDQDCRGPYFLVGGGIQRSRMYYEQRSVDGEGNEALRTLAVWPAADTPFSNFGFGYRGRSGAFIEGRVVLWRYRAEPGTRLMQTSPNASNQLRDATSFVTAIGVSF